MLRAVLRRRAIACLLTRLCDGSVTLVLALLDLPGAGAAWAAPPESALTDYLHN